MSTDYCRVPDPKKPNLWLPPCQPPEDYPLENPAHPPPSRIGGPVAYPVKDGDDAPATDFQDFVWDVVCAIGRINSALFAYRKGIALGVPPDQARMAYTKALQNYANVFLKWQSEANDASTWIQASVSHDGYVTDVLVRSRAFSIYTPGQSESHNSTNPPKRTP
jgi:hypothetical protein